MQNNKSKKKIALFGTVKILVFASFMCALSGVLKFLAPSGDTWRISFENFPIVFSGIVLGPFIASAVGIVSDLLGCLFRGYAVNPIITLASMSVGLISGISFSFFKKRKTTGIVFSTFVAHILSNIIIKTIALSLMYGMPFVVLFIERTGTYILTALAESLIILVLYRNKAIKNGLKRVIDNDL